MRRLFVDCGLDGAITEVYDDALLRVTRMPLMKDGTLNYREICDIFMDTSLIVIEQQFNPHGKAQKGAFTNASNFGALVALASLQCDNVEFVDPKEWKRTFNLLNGASRSPLMPKITKKDSVRKVNQLFGLKLGLSLDGIADSILIAEHWRIKNHREPFPCYLPKKLKRGSKIL